MFYQFGPCNIRTVSIYILYYTYMQAVQGRSKKEEMVGLTLCFDGLSEEHPWDPDFDISHLKMMKSICNLPGMRMIFVCFPKGRLANKDCPLIGHGILCELEVIFCDPGAAFFGGSAHNQPPPQSVVEWMPCLQLFGCQVWPKLIPPRLPAAS